MALNAGQGHVRYSVIHVTCCLCRTGAEMSGRRFKSESDACIGRASDVSLTGHTQPDNPRIPARSTDSLM